MCDISYRVSILNKLKKINIYIYIGYVLYIYIVAVVCGVYRKPALKIIYQYNCEEKREE